MRKDGTVYYPHEEICRATASFPIKIWMIWRLVSGSLLVSGEDQKEDRAGFRPLETEEGR